MAGTGFSLLLLKTGLSCLPALLSLILTLILLWLLAENIIVNFSVLSSLLPLLTRLPRLFSVNQGKIIIHEIFEVTNFENKDYLNLNVFTGPK